MNQFEVQNQFNRQQEVRSQALKNTIEIGEINKDMKYQDYKKAVDRHYRETRDEHAINSKIRGFSSVNSNLLL